MIGGIDFFVCYLCFHIKKGVVMIIARDLYSKSPKPYTVEYGSRREQLSGGSTTVVDFSFLKPRPGLNLDELQPLTPEWKKDMEYLILHSKIDYNL